MIKKILIGLLVILVAIQFIRPAKNNSADITKDITTLYPMPDSVRVIVEKLVQTVIPTIQNILFTQPFSLLAFG